MPKAAHRHIFKSLFFYMAYLGAGAGACLLALFLSMNFLTPAVSQENSPPTAVEAPLEPKKLTVKKVLRDIIKNAKALIQNLKGKTNTVLQKQGIIPAPPQNPALNPAQERETASSNIEAPQPQDPAGPAGNTEPAPGDTAVGNIEAPQPQDPAGPAGNVEPAPGDTAVDNIEAPQQQDQIAPAGNTEPAPGDTAVGNMEAPQPQDQIAPAGNTEPAPGDTAVGNMEAPQPQDQIAPAGNVEPAPGDTAVGNIEPPATADLDHSLRQPAAETPGQPEPTSDSHTPANLEVQSYMAPFIYESLKQKNPFNDPTAKQEKGIIIVPRTLPEKYELSDIKLKGMIWNNKIPKALFELPENNGFFTLLKGDKIGKNGVIFAIREDEVVIIETNPIGSGAQKREEKVIKIKKMDRMNLSSSF